MNNAYSQRLLMYKEKWAEFGDTDSNESGVLETAFFRITIKEDLRFRLGDLKANEIVCVNDACFKAEVAYRAKNQGYAISGMDAANFCARCIAAGFHPDTILLIIIHESSGDPKSMNSLGMFGLFQFSRKNVATYPEYGTTAQSQLVVGLLRFNKLLHRRTADHFDHYDYHCTPESLMAVQFGDSNADDVRKSFGVIPIDFVHTRTPNNPVDETGVTTTNAVIQWLIGKRKTMIEINQKRKKGRPHSYPREDDEQQRDPKMNQEATTDDGASLSEPDDKRHQARTFDRARRRLYATDYISQKKPPRKERVFFDYLF